MTEIPIKGAQRARGIGQPTLVITNAEEIAMASNIGKIFDTFKGWISLGQDAIDKGMPVAQDITTNAQNLFDIIKGAFQGKTPTPEQLAASDKAVKDLEERIRNS